MLDIGKIKISAISYVTEDFRRVKQAILNCIPEQYHNKSPSKTKITSQFSDPLIILQLELKGKEAEETLKFISSHLTAAEKLHIQHSLEDRTDLEEHAIHLRLNKFKAFEEKIELHNGSDIIKFVIKYLCYTKDQNTMENIIMTLEKFDIITHDSKI